MWNIEEGIVFPQELWSWNGYYKLQENKLYFKNALHLDFPNLPFQVSPVYGFNKTHQPILINQ